MGADSYPSDRITRQQRLLELPDGAFEALDDEFYALEGTVDLDAAMDLLAST